MKMISVACEDVYYVHVYVHKYLCVHVYVHKYLCVHCMCMYVCIIYVFEMCVFWYCFSLTIMATFSYSYSMPGFLDVLVIVN